jgi:adenylate kinase
VKKLIIALTGTPGTGKSSVAKLLRKKFRVIDLNRLIVRKKFFKAYDKKRKCWVADLKKVEKYLKERLKESEDVIIESHLAHLLSPRLIDIVIVLRCKPEELEKRLKRKKWNSEKIRENVEAEMIDLIAIEAEKLHEKVFEIDTTSSSLKKIAKEIEKIIKREHECS